MSTLIYDWNRVEAPPPPPRLLLDDETLRDGLQSVSACCPSIDEKIALLHMMERLGMDSADIGLPGAGAHVAADVERLARECVEARLRLRPNCAARTVIADIVPIADIAQRVGAPIEVAAFIGSSHIRQYVEDWTLDFLERTTEDAVAFAVREGLPVVYVTEDSTRAHPETLRRLYRAALRAGAARLCIADTVGHATPGGAAAIVGFVRAIAEEAGNGAEVDWHGHSDRGLSVINTIAAIDAGATRVHGTALGVGERVGNTPMDLLLINLVLMGYLERDLSMLDGYCQHVARTYGVAIPPSYPVFGRDAFRTMTGVHAAAVAKAYHKQDHTLADTVYSSIPAWMVGREQEIEVGPMSGRSNVVFWLEKRGYHATDDAVERIFGLAKHSKTVLTEEQILGALLDGEEK